MAQRPNRPDPEHVPELGHVPSAHARSRAPAAHDPQRFCLRRFMRRRSLTSSIIKIWTRAPGLAPHAALPHRERRPRPSRDAGAAPGVEAPRAAPGPEPASKS